MSDEGPHAEQDEPAAPRRTYINDVETSVHRTRRIAMRVDEPQWRLADVRAFVDFASSCGASDGARVFFGTFYAEVVDDRPQHDVEHTPPLRSPR